MMGSLLNLLFNVIFRTLSIPKAVSAKRVSQILLAVEFLEGNIPVTF